jgi:Xaa-Pro aminopeptidase
VDAVIDEAARAEALLEAQSRAAALFAAVDAQGLIRPGILESQASEEIRDLAANLLGVTRHWHKRVIRAGPNTLEPYRMNPPDRFINDDDIVFADLGPIFEEWEADFGRTYVIGDDPVKLRLRDDLADVFALGRNHFEASPDITGEQLFDFMVAAGEARGWEWGGTIAGHIVGEFPHTEFDADHALSLVAPGSTLPMRGVDTRGRVAHWILEVHLVDRGREIGGFYEELLDL